MPLSMSKRRILIGLGVLVLCLAVAISALWYRGHDKKARFLKEFFTVLFTSEKVQTDQQCLEALEPYCTEAALRVISQRGMIGAGLFATGYLKGFRDVDFATFPQEIHVGRQDKASCDYTVVLSLSGDVDDTKATVYGRFQWASSDELRIQWISIDKIIDSQGQERESLIRFVRRKP